jgi:hypothetical protein
MEQIRTDSVAPQRLNVLLLGIFASVAVILASVGIYDAGAKHLPRRRVPRHLNSEP